MNRMVTGAVVRADERGFGADGKRQFYAGGVRFAVGKILYAVFASGEPGAQTDSVHFAVAGNPQGCFGKRFH